MKKIEIEDKDFDVIKEVQNQFGYEMFSTAVTKLVDEYRLSQEIRGDYDQMADLIEARRRHRDKIRQQNEQKRSPKTQ